jgi:hypothetical protein
MGEACVQAENLCIQHSILICCQGCACNMGAYWRTPPCQQLMAVMRNRVACPVLHVGSGAYWIHVSSSSPYPLLAGCRYLWSSGTLCVLAAALIFSVSALLVKLTGNRIPVLQITLVRSSLSWLVGVTLCWQQGISPMFGHRERLGWLVMRGLSGGWDSMSCVSGCRG